MRVDYSTFEGFEVKGYPDTVLSRGRIIVANSTLKTRGGGRFVPRARCEQLLR